jgi:hypothetical protein
MANRVDSAFADEIRDSVADARRFEAEFVVGGGHAGFGDGEEFDQAGVGRAVVLEQGGGVVNELVVSDTGRVDVEGSVGEGATSAAGDLEEAARVAEFGRVHEHVHARGGKELMALDEALTDEARGDVFRNVVEDERSGLGLSANVL